MLFAPFAQCDMQTPKRRNNPMKTRQKLLLMTTGIAVVLMLLFNTGVGRGQSTGTTIRWDLASWVNTTTFAPGGVANAFADDGSKITVTGSGTFVTSRFSKGPLAGISFWVTGGGNWQTFDPQGNSTGSGTYKVRRLDRFEAAPGQARSWGQD
jgi:hypothetical protein